MTARITTPPGAGGARLRAAAGALVGLALCGCRQADEPPRAPPPDVAAPAQSDVALQLASPPQERPDRPAYDWSRHLGRCVVAEGYRAGAKIGPRLESGAWAVGVDLAAPEGDAAWWALPGGARVRVRGIVAERSDLPVFLPRPGEPVPQGIPVPPGTDLDKARRRYVIEQASVTLARGLDAVEAALHAHVGNDVGLNGLVLSVNGHFWFQHDGVDIHLEGQERLPGWRDLHGRAVTLHGRLERRRLPRLDQILLKPNPDLAEAFLLRVTRMADHPDWAVTDCTPKP